MTSAVDGEAERLADLLSTNERQLGQSFREHRLGHGPEVVLDVDDGMPERSAVSLDNLRTVPKAMLTKRLTELSLVRRQEVGEALRFAVDC